MYQQAVSTHSLTWQLQGSTEVTEVFFCRTWKPTCAAGKTHTVRRSEVTQHYAPLDTSPQQNPAKLFCPEWQRWRYSVYLGEDYKSGSNTAGLSKGGFEAAKSESRGPLYRHSTPADVFMLSNEKSGNYQRALLYAGHPGSCCVWKKSVWWLNKWELQLNSWKGFFQGATVAWWLAFHRKKRWASTPGPFWVTFQHSPHDCVDSQVLCWQKRCKTLWKESTKNECVQLNRNWLDCFWRWLRGAGLSLAWSHWRGRYYTSGTLSTVSRDTLIQTKTSMLNEDLLSLFFGGGVKTKESAHSVAVVL